MTGRQATSLYLWRACALVVGPGIDSKIHSHFATQLTVGLDRPFRARLTADTAWSTTKAAIFAPNQAHQIDSDGLLAHLFIDIPHPVGGAANVTNLRSEHASLPGFASVGNALQLACVGQLDLDGAVEAARLWQECALPDSWSPNGFDPRIAQTLAWIAEQDRRTIPGAELAGRVHLSESRFTHLFRQQTGLSVSRYLLWTRLLAALDAIASGANMTAAAHQAGFADLAHMSRTFRHTFGVVPSELQKMTIAFKRDRL